MFQSTQSKANMAIIRLNQAVEKMAAHLKQPGHGTAMLSILTSSAVDPGSATSNSAASQYALSTNKPPVMDMVMLYAPSFHHQGRPSRTALRSLFSSPGQALQDTDEEILEPLLLSRHALSSSSPQFQLRMSVCSARSSMACTTHHSKRAKAKRTIYSPFEVSSISELPDMPADPAAHVITGESCRHFSCYCSPVYCPKPTGTNMPYSLLMPQNQESARGSEGNKTSIRCESSVVKVNEVRIAKGRQSSNLEASSPVHEPFIQQQQYQLQHLHQHLPGMTDSALILETHSSTVGNFVSKSLLDEDFSVRFRNQSLSISPPLVTSLPDLFRQEGGDRRLIYTNSSAPLSVGGMNLLSQDTLSRECTLSLAKSAVRSAQGALDSWQGGMALLKTAASHNTCPHFEDYTKGQSDVACSFSKLCLKMTSIDWSEGVRVEQSSVLLILIYTVGAMHGTVCEADSKCGGNSSRVGGSGVGGFMQT
ncbi:hypothetical protein CEUSTIGMA_g7048.t1 [Chlamydomonas eustigma]|uniref:Uncharacterized protein n=1 Tax=Chlamydomonas eustigma TaxID=1157962 RepID=A0A250X969_9CHLO|nr:hypothetical protein CEUSTIGMA_g7048.t1 [Chlamydomonas eustigma]|eukprot:GAX79607.1 hypothetical protein CEUSTIGMA_g7048.t1 [Chlamydomonas eustigma]